MAFFEIISVMFSVLLYAILASMALMGLLLMLLRTVDRRCVGTIPFFFSGTFLAIILVVQYTLMFGAMRVRSTLTAWHDTVAACAHPSQQSLEVAPGSPSEVSSESLSQRLYELNDDSPVIDAFRDILGFSFDVSAIPVDDMAQIPDTMFREANDRLSTFIWHRVWWIAGMSILSCALVLFLPRRRVSHGSNQYGYDDTSFESSSKDVGDWGF